MIYVFDFETLAKAGVCSRQPMGHKLTTKPFSVALTNTNFFPILHKFQFFFSNLRKLTVFFNAVSKHKYVVYCVC